MTDTRKEAASGKDEARITPGPLYAFEAKSAITRCTADAALSIVLGWGTPNSASAIRRFAFPYFTTPYLPLSHFAQFECGVGFRSMTGLPSNQETLKTAVQAFWNKEACGEIYAIGNDLKRQLETVRATRFELVPYLTSFADFDSGHDRDVLEIGIGMGTDHLEWAKAVPRRLVGIDLTPRAVEMTRDHLQLYNFVPHVFVGDAENLAFPDSSFDIVYSCGVIHHTPDTKKAINEIHRVLRPGGEARILIYHLYSLSAFLIWLRYGLLRGRPLMSFYDASYNHLESPGTKLYSVSEARALFGRFSTADIYVRLSFWDLLQSVPAQKDHGSLAFRALQAMWPRWFIRRFLHRNGHYLLIHAVK